MAIIWADSFDHYGTGGPGRTNMAAGAWAEVSSSASIVSTRARTGARSLEFTGQVQLSMARRVVGSKFVVGVCTGVFLPSLPTTNSKCAVAQFRDNTNTPIATFYIQTDGSIAMTALGVLVGVSDPVIGASSWNHVEAKLTIDSVVGSGEVRVNGVTVLNITDLNIGTKAAASVVFGFPSNFDNTPPEYYIDDVITWDDTGPVNNDFLGPQRVQTLFPNGDTAAADWAKNGAATGFDAIDDTAPDGDATHLGSNVVGQISEFTLPTLPPETAAIAGVYIPALAKIENAGAGGLQVSLVSGAAVASGPDTLLTTAYTYWPNVLEVDPATGKRWTKAGLEAAKVRIRKTV